jgi:hypothetical protein
MHHLLAGRCSGRSVRPQAPARCSAPRGRQRALQLPGQRRSLMLQSRPRQQRSASAPTGAAAAGGDWYMLCLVLPLATCHIVEVVGLAGFSACLLHHGCLHSSMLLHVKDHFQAKAAKKRKRSNWCGCCWLFAASLLHVFEPEGSARGSHHRGGRISKPLALGWC